MSVTLPDESLPSIANDRITNLLARGDADPGLVFGRRSKEEDEMAGELAPSASLQAKKFPTPPQPGRGRMAKSGSILPTRHRALFLSGRDRDGLTALTTAAVQETSATDGRHATAKTVCATALEFTRLKCALHSPFLRENRDTRDSMGDLNLSTVWFIGAPCRANEHLGVRIRRWKIVG